jgi:Na+-exporting ATPase
MLAYGIWMASLCLLSFVVIVWGFGDGNLGLNCNETYSASCDLIFRARATTFVCMTWFALILAWEMVDMRHSFFAAGWTQRVYRNKFLFWAIIAGVFTIFPTLYIPVINHDVFKHEGISWEWGVVFVEALAFVLGVECWKWCKRLWLRRLDKKERRNTENELRLFVQHLELPYSSPV